jgi:CRP-like cAMP-binding protein
MMKRHNRQGETDNILDLKQHELAGLIGASRESVSRTLSDFEARGILSTHRGGLVILDLEKLKLISG